MKKFIIRSFKGSTSIIEIEIEIITALDDPSVMWLPANEYKAKVISPTSLFEKNSTDKLVPPIYYSHAFYDSYDAAYQQAIRDIQTSYERTCLKQNKEPSKEDIDTLIAKIK